MSQSVDRALSILTLLADSPRSNSELAAHLRVHRSTALRILQTLERHGFVHHDSHNRYRLGAHLVALANQALEAMDLRQIAAPHLEKLNQALGQTVHLAVYEDGEVVYIDKYESRQPIRMYSRAGKRAPIHCTGIAKAVVAFLPERERLAVAKRLNYERYTSRTIRNSKDFLRELDQVRKRGFALDRGEHEDLIQCVAAPVRNGTGEVRAAISITALAMVLDTEDLIKTAPKVRDVAEKISREYGWQPQ